MRWIFVATVAVLCSACISGGETDEPEASVAVPAPEAVGTATEDFAPKVTRCQHGCFLAEAAGCEDYHSQCDDEESWPPIATYGSTALTCVEAFLGACGAVERCIDQCNHTGLPETTAG